MPGTTPEGFAFKISSIRMSEDPLITIGMFSRAAACASTRSPRYAERAQMPIGAIPMGADQVRLNKVVSVERLDVSTKTLVTNSYASNALEFARSE